MRVYVVWCLCIHDGLLAHAARDRLNGAPIGVSVTSALEREEVVSYVFHQMHSVETVDPLRVEKHGLYFSGTCQKLSHYA